MPTRKASSLNYLIAVDIGTSSCKAMALDPDGRLLAEAARPCETKRAKPGFAEQDPERIREDLEQLLRSIQDQLPGGQPRCVSFSSAMHSLMAVDGQNRPLSPLLIWSDARSVAQATWLRAQSGARDLYQRSGTPIHPMSPLCKLLWWRHQQTDLFEAADAFLSIKDYVFARWFGERICDYSLASASGLMDQEALQWYEPALELSGVKRRNLPDLASPLQACRNLHPEAARAMGLDPGTPFVLGASDGCLANAGSGILESGKAALTIGTSAALRVYSRQRLLDPSGRLFCYLLLEGEYILGGAINNGGILLDWAARNWFEGLGKDRGILRALEEAFRAPAASRGLLFLPYILGERAPMWDARARGAFIGLTWEHTRAHQIRAMLEGNAYALYQICELLVALGVPVGEVAASGGFLKTPAWAQLCSDVFGLPFVQSSPEDASSLGAAMLGWRFLHPGSGWTSLPSAAASTARWEPDSNLHETYQRSYQLFRDLYPLLEASMHQMASWEGL